MGWLLSLTLAVTSATWGGFGFAFTMAANPRSGGGSSGGSLGWKELPNTKLQSVCPPVGDNQPRYTTYDFPFYCQDVIRGFSGAIADTKRNRLVIWGGGHHGYYGNELYALDVTAGKLTRLNRPSPIANPDSSNSVCIDTLSDGNPNSRHTYNGLVYIAHADKMFAFGGSLSCGPGSGAADTWILDLATLKWTRAGKNGDTDQVGYYLGAAAVYDPNTKTVFLNDRRNLYQYTYETDTYKKVSDFGLLLNMAPVLDPKRKLLFFFGNDEGVLPSVWVVSIAPGSNYAKQDWTAQVQGCDALMTGEDFGMAYDPVQDRIVAWPNFGNTVYIFNPNTKTCSTQTFAGGPPDSEHKSTTRTSTGTYGRFRYFPDLGVFALVNDWDIDAFTLRLTLASRQPQPKSR